MQGESCVSLSFCAVLETLEVVDQALLLQESSLRTVLKVHDTKVAILSPRNDQSCVAVSIGILNVIIWASLRGHDTLLRILCKNETCVPLVCSP